MEKKNVFFLDVFFLEDIFFGEKKNGKFVVVE